MMQKTIQNISDIMYRDHCRIEAFLNSFNIDIMDFNELKWQIEKHFIVEEKAILTFFSVETKEEEELLGRIQEEHEQILQMLDNLEIDENLFSEFKSTLIKHRDFEDEVFYPLLDTKLNDIQKQEVLDHIQEYNKSERGDLHE